MFYIVQQAFLDAILGRLVIPSFLQASNGKKRAKDSDSDYEDGIEDEEEVGLNNEYLSIKYFGLIQNFTYK